MIKDEILEQLNRDLHDMLKLYEHAHYLYDQTTEPLTWHQMNDSRIHSLIIESRHKQRGKIKEQMDLIHVEIDSLCRLIT